MGRTSRTSAMNQIFLRSALSRSSRLAMGPIRTSRAFTDPAVLTFLASLDLGVSAWTLYIARACDWELGIITAISMCHLGNVFDCLLGILYELFSSGPTKASTAGMNAGTGRTVFLFVIRMLVTGFVCFRSLLSPSKFELMALFTLPPFRSLLLRFCMDYIWLWFWELFGFALLILLLGGLLLLSLLL